MNEHFFVGKRVSSFDEKKARLPISKVVLWLDSQNAIVSGDDTGTVIEQDCPYATQEMADNLLSVLSGYSYQPFSASNAVIDPLAELGDGITVNGQHGVLGYQKIYFASGRLCDISAPGEGEVFNEYAVGGYNKAETNRELKKVNSSISKTAEEIRLEVGQEINGYTDEDGNFVNGLKQTISELSVGVEGFEVSVRGALGTDEDGALLSVSSVIEAALGEITLSVDNAEEGSTITLQYGDISIESPVITMKGVVTFAGLEDGTTTIDGSCIKTGTISAKRIKVSEIKVTDLDGSDELVTEDNVTTITQNAIKTAKISADQITTGVLDAGAIALDGLLELKNGTARGYVGANNAKGGAVLASENTSVYVIANNTTAKMSSFENHMIWVHTSGCFATDTLQISSDRTMKDNIDYDLSEEEKLFSTLLPCSFSYISDKSAKKHWGFIAQDFIASAQDLDMDTDKLAVLGKYDGKYSIGYGEITALNTHMIQRLMRRVAALESRLEE